MCVVGIHVSYQPPLRISFIPYRWDVGCPSNLSPPMRVPISFIHSLPLEGHCTYHVQWTLAKRAGINYGMS
jgi:hypothetical protein